MAVTPQMLVPAAVRSPSFEGKPLLRHTRVCACVCVCVGGRASARAFELHDHAYTWKLNDRETQKMEKVGGIRVTKRPSSCNETVLWSARARLYNERAFRACSTARKHNNVANLAPATH